MDGSDEAGPQRLTRQQLDEKRAKRAEQTFLASHRRDMRQLRFGQAWWSVGCSCGWTYPAEVNLRKPDAKKLHAAHVEAARVSRVTP